MAKSICSAEGCERPRSTHGLCSMHYKRRRRTGTVGGGKRSEMERFLSKVNTDRPTMPHMDTPCHVWKAKTDRHGYGVFVVVVDKKRVYRSAHRCAWILHRHDITSEVFVLHRCDNPPCVNPNHLFLGTAADNAADKVAKGRHPRGEQSASSVLTDKAVTEIRQRYARGETQLSLAQEHGVTASAISSAIRRQTWSHVP